MGSNSNEESRAVQVARAFFAACTKLSDNIEDILPQEDAPDRNLSVFRAFSELFPEYANDKDRPGSAAKNGLMRLQFNKIGYEIYDKEQSRRVPAVRAKPGNPGYGFRRARWRDTMTPGKDKDTCERVLTALGVNGERLDRIKSRVEAFKAEWDLVRRPSRPAGPGRPRGHKRGAVGALVVPDGAVVAPESGGGSPLLAGVVEALVISGEPSPPSAVASKKQKKCATPRAGGSGGRQQQQQQAASQCPGALAEASVAASASATWDCAHAGPEADGGAEGLYGHGQAQAAQLTPAEENSSLRSLNKSLIADRETLMRQVEEQEREVADLAHQCRDLLAPLEALGPDQSELASAFRAAFARLAMGDEPPPTDGSLDVSPEGAARLDGAIAAYGDHVAARARDCLLQGAPCACRQGSPDPLWDSGLDDEQRSCAELREMVAMAAASVDRTARAAAPAGSLSPQQRAVSRSSSSGRLSGADTPLCGSGAESCHAHFSEVRVCGGGSAGGMFEDQVGPWRDQDTPCVGDEWSNFVSGIGGGESFCAS
eukprot:CAMPEP_0174931960 /NCGR_PEP_ID=MMETSP1355-20121228/35445_1 /TAXON_ID=464990 /ORGANISM="Hemiselmis tepida, Strain CCMP443" /LENGTH=541 /DNA_ID=CAMNT_0016178357 /DNA_START=113 /DNA_END=1735 /DNA_ORIENTATION=+